MFSFTVSIDWVQKEAAVTTQIEKSTCPRIAEALMIENTFPKLVVH